MYASGEMTPGEIYQKGQDISWLNLGISNALLTNPTFHHISLPDELKKGWIIHESGPALVSSLLQRVQFIFQQLTALTYVLCIVITLK